MKTIVDLNRDGMISKEDLETSNELLELELREEKAESQKKMAWVAIISMIIVTLIVMNPIMSDSRVQALSDLLGLFYIAMAGIVGAYMGVTAWMSKTASNSVSRFGAITTARAVPQPRETEI